MTGFHPKNVNILEKMTLILVLSHLSVIEYKVGTCSVIT